MFKLRVTKVRDGVEGRSAEVVTSVPQAAIDHLHASAGRYGFTVTHNRGTTTGGELLKEDRYVGHWNMEEVAA